MLWTAVGSSGGILNSVDEHGAVHQVLELGCSAQLPPTALALSESLKANARAACGEPGPLVR